MNELVAMPLERFPVTQLKHVRDLIYFDGPLLSEFRHKNGESYLYYWCDCNEQANRWMVFRVSEATLLRLTERILSLGEVIPRGSRDDFVYFLDMFSDGSIKACLVMPEAIPVDYLPAPSTFLEPLEPSPDTHSCSFLLEGEWSMKAIGDFTEAFNGVYSFVYEFGDMHSQEFATHSRWGKINHLHFFRDLTSAVPARDRPYVEAIQMFSPGFMRFSLNTKTAEQVIQCVKDFRSHDQGIISEMYFLRDYVDNFRESVFEEFFFSLSRIGSNSIKKLLQNFTVFNVGRFMEMFSEKNNLARLVLLFVGYVEVLLGFERDGLIVFPKSR